jgi:hypothetical protein
MDDSKIVLANCSYIAAVPKNRLQSENPRSVIHERKNHRARVEGRRNTDDQVQVVNTPTRDSSN